MHIGDHAIGAGPQTARRLIVADDRTISYGELYARSQRVAALLYEAGLRRGDGVALVLPNRPEFLEITWGCQLSGLYYSAVNTHFTPDEVAYVVDDSEAQGGVHRRSRWPTWGRESCDAQPPRRRPYLSSAAPCPAGARTRTRSRAAGDAPPVSDGSEMLYSSGTTGRPKAVRRPLPEDGKGSWAQKVLEYIADAAIRHDRVERVPFAGAALPRGGRQLHDGGSARRRGLDRDAQVRRRGRAAADRDPPRHACAVRADHVRADAEAAGRGPGVL